MRGMDVAAADTTQTDECEAEDEGFSHAAKLTIAHSAAMRALEQFFNLCLLSVC